MQTSSGSWQTPLKAVHLQGYPTVNWELVGSVLNRNPKMSLRKKSCTLLGWMQSSDSLKCCSIKIYIRIEIPSGSAKFKYKIGWRISNYSRREIIRRKIAPPPGLFSQMIGQFAITSIIWSLWNQSKLLIFIIRVQNSCLMIRLMICQCEDVVGSLVDDVLSSL